MSKKKKPCCNECGAVFTAGDELFSWENAFVCGDCFDGLCSELSRIERAVSMGCEVRIYDIDF